MIDFPRKNTSPKTKRRMPTVNAEVERRLIGDLNASRVEYESLIDFFTAADFGSPTHAFLFDRIRREMGKPVADVPEPKRSDLNAAIRKINRDLRSPWPIYGVAETVLRDASRRALEVSCATLIAEVDCGFMTGPTISLTIAVLTTVLNRAQELDRLMLQL